jgi:hypothetical protein
VANAANYHHPPRKGQGKRKAAPVEHDSEHTIATGILRSTEERKLTIPRAEAFEAIPGKGVKARVDGRELCFRSLSVCLSSQRPKPDDLDCAHPNHCCPNNGFKREVSLFDMLVRNSMDKRERRGCIGPTL